VPVAIAVLLSSLFPRGMYSSLSFGNASGWMKRAGRWGSNRRSCAATAVDAGHELEPREGFFVAVTRVRVVQPAPGIVRLLRTTRASDRFSRTHRRLFGPLRVEPVDVDAAYVSL